MRRRVRDSGEGGGGECEEREGMRDATWRGRCGCAGVWRLVWAGEEGGVEKRGFQLKPIGVTEHQSSISWQDEGLASKDTPFAPLDPSDGSPRLSS